MIRCITSLSLCVIFLLVLTATNSAAFPIEPVSLRTLIEKSELIIYAKVEPPPARKPRVEAFKASPFGGESPARLRMLSVLKGTSPTGLVNVYFNPNMVCPSPPRFSANSNVLAFLVSFPASNGFRTVGLHYGAKLLSEEDASRYARHIRDYLAFLPEVDPKRKALRITEWLVQCAEDAVTRHEGAEELADGRTMLGKPTRSKFGPLLSASQMSRLSNVLFQAKLPTSGELALTPLFKNSAKPQLAQLYLRYLRQAARPFLPQNDLIPDRDAFPEPWNVYDLIFEASDFFGSEAARQIVTKTVRTDFFSATQRIYQVSLVLPLLDQAATKKGFSTRSTE